MEASFSHTWHLRRDSSNESKNMDALETKLEQLKLAVTRTDSIIALNNEVAIERHLNAIKALTMEVDSLKRAVEEQKIAAKDDPEDLNQWNSSASSQQMKAVRSLNTTSRNFAKEQS